MSEKMVIENERIQLILLAVEDLKLWLKDKRFLEDKIEKEMDYEEIKGPLMRAFEIKIGNLEKNPGSEVWHSYFAIATDNKIIGAIGPKGEMNRESAIEIGYGINEKYWNKGIMTEALALFCDYYLNRLGVGKIVAETDRDNLASQKVLIKNSFVRLAENEKTVIWCLTR